MNFDYLNDMDKLAIKSAMEYWVSQWDKECPTLFGIDIEVMISVIEQWPNVAAGSETKFALATLGSLRELLYGASAVNEEQVKKIVGISYSDADILCRKLHKRVGEIT